MDRHHGDGGGNFLKTFHHLFSLFFFSRPPLSSIQILRIQTARWRVPTKPINFPEPSRHWQSVSSVREKIFMIVPWWESETFHQFQFSPVESLSRERVKKLNFSDQAVKFCCDENWQTPCSDEKFYSDLLLTCFLLPFFHTHLTHSHLPGHTHFPLDCWQYSRMCRYLHRAKPPKDRKFIFSIVSHCWSVRGVTGDDVCRSEWYFRWARCFLGWFHC